MLGHTIAMVVRQPIAMALFGFMAGVGGTVFTGPWMLREAHSHLAQPLPPDTGYCGMPMIGALCRTLCAWPFGGAVGGAGGLIVAMFCRLVDAMIAESEAPAAGRLNARRRCKPD